MSHPSAYMAWLTHNSIIFSCWTRTLHLIGRYLEEAKIPYLQLDGNSPLPQRQQTLHKFEEGEETPVLIMTTGTGAFGQVLLFLIHTTRLTTL